MTDLNKIRAAQVRAAEQAAIADLPPELLVGMAPKSPCAQPMACAVQRALSAWDTTTLKTNGDGMLSEAMESLRAEFDASLQAPEGAQAAVMRQALEALEIIAAQDRSEGFESGRATASAIAALRAALAAQAPQAPVALTDAQVDDLSREMVKGNKSVNWLCRAIEAAHGITQTKEPTNDR